MSDETPEAVVEARAAAEAIRALNHLTRSGRGGLTYPSDVQQVVGELASLMHRLPQALNQLSRVVGEICATPGLYDDRNDGRDMSLVPAAAQLWLVRSDLLHACATAAERLTDASNRLSHLGVRDA